MMQFWQLINAPQNLPFMVALVIMGLLFVLEVASLLLGGVNDWIDGLLPDSLMDSAHPEVGIDAVDAGIFVRFLSWLYVGRVPLLMLMVVFLAVFGVTGYALQATVFGLFGFFVPTLLAVVGVWLVSLPVVRVCAQVLYKILPKDETTAVSENELVGRVGVVVIGTATVSESAQVKVKDIHGQVHYVMAYADGEPLSAGTAVLLVAKDGMYFKMIANPSGVMVD